MTEIETLATSLTVQLARSVYVEEAKADAEALQTEVKALGHEDLQEATIYLAMVAAAGLNVIAGYTNQDPALMVQSWAAIRAMK